jgi:hypothetical protein
MGDFNTPSVFRFSKEVGGLKSDISKPPLDCYILFWRTDNQPPQQRFFYYPVCGRKSDYQDFNRNTVF